MIFKNNWPILFLICIFFTGCKSPSSQKPICQEKNSKLKIVSTIAMINDLVCQIGQDEIEAITLIKGELDPHSYELVKGDSEKFQTADLIFYNGLGLEHGLSLRKQLENNKKAVAISKTLIHLYPEQILYFEEQYDPHIWMDVSLWAFAIDPIVEALSQANPSKADQFALNGKKLKEKLNAIDFKAYTILQAIPEEKRYLVTSHDAFNYFARRYLATDEERKNHSWNKRCAAPEGLAPEAQLSVIDIQEIISHIQKYRINVLFAESNVSKDSLKKILNASLEKGLNVRLAKEALYGDSMGLGTYEQMILHNVKVIANELQS